MWQREFRDLRLAFGVFREPFAWGVMALSLGGTALIFLGLAVSVGWLLARVDWLERLVGAVWWDVWLMSGVGVLVVAVLAWFAFPVVVTAVAGMFLEPLADRLERRYYPAVPAARAVPLTEQVASSLRVLGRGIGWNLLVSPLYFVPVLNVVVYAGLNAFLLSREYFQVVAVRHVSIAEAKERYREHRGQMLRGGLVLAAMFVVPGLNLCAPLLATGWMVHRIWGEGDLPLWPARTDAAGKETDRLDP